MLESGFPLFCCGFFSPCLSQRESEKSNAFVGTCLRSSTINALLGEKLVSVSSTPGKTKHFQTIHLTPDIILCDCPGLVFPTFSTTKADQVCNGVLPIDQLREFTGPVALVTQ